MNTPPSRLALRGVVGLVVAQLITLLAVRPGGAAIPSTPVERPSTVATAQVAPPTEPVSPATPNVPEGRESPNAWIPGPGTVFTYPVGTEAVTITVLAVVPITPNLATAAYLLFNPSTGETRSYPAEAAQTPEGVSITARNMPIEVSGQEVQFFILPLGGGLAEFSPRYRIVRIARTFVPIMERPGAFEPNDTACDATGTVPGATYTGQNDDLYDWFKIPLGSRGDFSITVAGFSTLAYLELWRSTGGCETLELLQAALLPAMANPVIARVNQPVGDYFVRIVSLAPDTASYTFSWQFAPAPAELEPNNTACQSTFALQGQTYLGRDDDQNDWFQVSLGEAGNVAISVTNYSGIGAVGFFTATAGNCALVGAEPASSALLSQNPTVLSVPFAQAGNYFVRVQNTFQSGYQTYGFAWSLRPTELEPNNTACQATTALPGQLYNGRDDDAFDWFSFSLTGTGSAAITVTGYAGAQGFLEVFSATGGNCAQLSVAPVASRTLTSAATVLQVSGVASGTYYAAIRNPGAASQAPYSFLWSPGYALSEEFEPNNNACQATPILLDRAYGTFAQDQQDWFVFSVPTSGRIQILLSKLPASSTNPVRTDTELYVYRESGSCNALTRVDLAAQDNIIPAIDGYYLLAMSNQPATKYYLQIQRNTAYNNTQPYQLFITQGDVGVWAPRVMACPSQETGCGRQDNGNITVYYYGMLIGTQLTLGVTGLPCGTICGCPVGPSVTQSTFATTAESGTFSFTGIATGYYKLYATAVRTGFPQWGDEKPIKMGCEFLAASREFILGPPR